MTDLEEKKKNTLMVIEGDGDLHDILEDLFRKEGYNYTKMTSGIQACQNIESANLEEIDLIIMDLSLPDVNSIAVKRCIQKQFGGKIPVLHLVRWSAKRNISAELQEDESYLTLPFQFRELLDKVRGLIENK